MYHCSACLTESPTKLSKCPNPSCRAWGRFVSGTPVRAGKVQNLSDVRVENYAYCPISSEFDEVIGGGAVRGGSYLVGGEPGIGKSTLMLQALCTLCTAEERGLYVSGEEMSGAIKARANRIEMNTDYVDILETQDINKAVETLNELRPAWALVDSVQEMRVPDLGVGSIQGQREVIARLNPLGHKFGIGLFVISHVTKDGEIAGPKQLEHTVDCVVNFEGDKRSSLRLLRTQKNRFGPHPRLGLFRMTGKGLVDAGSPKELLAGRIEAPGSVIAAAWEDGRPMIVEVQALVTERGSSQLSVNGVSSKRVEMVLAILQRHTGIVLGTKDIYVNIVGGIKIDDTGLDLPIALAISSAISKDMQYYFDAYTGELGLLGEILPGDKIEERIRAADRAGFKLKPFTEIKTALGG